MGKLKHTKLKHRKHKDSDDNNKNSVNHETHDTRKKYKILTSKNKNKLVLKEGRYYRKNDSINKKHKRSQKHFNIRTLDALKKYGVTLKNQDGGFIISYLKFKWNMRKIKKIIAKLGKNKVEMNAFIHSYEKQPETFKRLGDKKAVVIYDILRTIKDKTIIQFLLDNKDNEKTYDTSNMEHDLNNIKTKIEITTANQLKQYNKEIEKEKPILAKNLAKFRKDSEKFRKINEEYSKIMDFYEEQRELSDKYHSIAKDEKITNADKAIKKKYLKNEENIKYILSYKQEDINELNNSLKKIATLMNMSDDYDAKFKDLTEGKYETDLQKWQVNYKDIYVNITDIEGGIKNVSDTLEKIKEYADQIGSNLSSIYAAIKQSFKLDPILKVKRIIDENLGYLKNVKEVSLKKVKYAFIEQIPIEQIEIYLPLASAALIQTEKSMNELNTSFILDSSFIRTGHAGGGSDRWKGRRMGMDGVGGINGISNIGELEWFGNGGATAITYENLLKLTIDRFLDTDYEDIFETLKKINDDIMAPNYNSDIYTDLTNSQILNIMKIYLNICMFLLYYKTRDLIGYRNTPFIYNTNINDLIKIIKFFEIIEKKFSKFNEITNTMKEQFRNLIANFDKIYNHINHTILPLITTSYFNKRPAISTHIWNPFIDKNKEDSIKNLYYTHNPTPDTEHLGCIKAFLGYYDKKLTDQYNDKKKCIVDKDTILEQKTLHNDSMDDDLLLIYYNDNDREHIFVSIYYDEDKIPSNKIKYKKIGQFNQIKNKYNDLEHFIVNGPIQPFNPVKNAEQLKKFKDKTSEAIYESNNKLLNNISDNKLYCSKTTHDDFETKINNMLRDPQYNSKITGDNNSEAQISWAISFMKNRIIEANWRGANYFLDNSKTVTQTTITFKMLELAELYATLAIDAIDVATPANIASREIISFVSILVNNNDVRAAILASDNDLNAVINSIKKAEEEVRYATRPLVIGALGAGVVGAVAGVNIDVNIQSPFTVANVTPAIAATAAAIQLVISKAIGISVGGESADQFVNKATGILPPILKVLVASIERKKDVLKHIANIYENNIELQNTVDSWRTILPNAAVGDSGSKIVASVSNTALTADEKTKEIQSILLSASLTPLPPLQQITFHEFINGGQDTSLLIDPIIPLLLKNIYNNIKFDNPIEGYHPSNTLLPANAIIPAPRLDPTLLPVKILKVDSNGSKYIVLYKCAGDNTTILNNYIKPNDNMKQYYFTWLTSKCNSSNPLKTDNMSLLIEKLYENKALSSQNLSSLNLDDLDKNPFINSFEKNDKQIFLAGVDGTDPQLVITKFSLTIEDDKNIYNNTSPILREELRLAFDLPNYTKINENIIYPDKKLFTDFKEISPITKLTNKKGDYKNIPLQFVKRIVSFNVNNWNRSVNKVDQIKPKPDSKQDLLTNPKNAIDFIKKYLPGTDVLGLLNYSLYSNEATAVKHIQSRIKLPLVNTDPQDIKVDNKYTEQYIENELKLEQYVIKNDNYDRVIKLPIIDDDDHMFLGKALYYNDKSTPMSNQVTLPKDKRYPDSILYSEVKITDKSTKPIGLYLVNTYNYVDIAFLTTLIKTIDDNKKNNGEIEEIVIMGTFLLDPGYTKDQIINFMKTENYTQFGKMKDTCIDTNSIDLCFISDDFEKNFTILNDEIIVPSGSISSHYPIYLDIIENDDMDIEDNDFIVIYSDGNIIIKDKLNKIMFKLTLKKKILGGGAKSSAKSKTKPKPIKISSTNGYDIEVVDLDGKTITDDRYKSVLIDKDNTNIINIKDKDGKIRMTIDKDARKITRFKEDGTIESTSEIDKDGTIITKDKDGKEILKTIDGADGTPITKDISTGEVVKTYYEEEDDEIEKAKKEGKRLLSTFMDDVKKENLTMVSKNRDSILSYIKKINDLIQTKLKPKNYEDIKLKLDALAKNIIELKAIEPKLTPDKVLIKEYAQKARSYDWMEDVTKREKTSLSLQDEAKELEAIIKTHPEIKDILPSSSESITKEEIQELILAIPAKTKILNKSDSINKILKKIQSKYNMNLVIKYLNDHYISNTIELCRIANTIHSNTYTKEMSDLIQKFDCSSKEKEEYEKKKEKKK